MPINKLQANIKHFTKSGEVLLVELLEIFSNKTFKSLIIDNKYNIYNNQSCKILIKESDIILCENKNKHNRIDKYETIELKLSANTFEAIIIEIMQDEIFARIFLDFHGNTITALILKESLKELNINKEEKIRFCINPSDIMLEFSK